MVLLKPLLTSEFCKSQNDVQSKVPEQEELQDPIMGDESAMEYDHDILFKHLCVALCITMPSLDRTDPCDQLLLPRYCRQCKEESHVY